MIDTVYIEEDALELLETKRILERFPNARKIPCAHYGEVFNPKSQNFRLQKRKPALILAIKKGKRFHPTPPGYGIGHEHNYYFAHMQNCIYDCRYCFLQGMYRSAHYVLFVNDSDFFDDMDALVDKHGEVALFSGYDCDSLAFETYSRFTERFLPYFERETRAFLELRTKSIHISRLLNRAPLKNCVVAFTLSPEDIIRRVEHGTPSLENRLKAMQKLGLAGWKLGLRFDPLLLFEGYQGSYRALFKRTFEFIHPEWIHSVTIGTFRLPKSIYNNMLRAYPRDRVLSAQLVEDGRFVSYTASAIQEMLAFSTEELLKTLRPNILFLPQTSDGDTCKEKQKVAKAL